MRSVQITSLSGQVGFEPYSTLDLATCKLKKNIIIISIT